MDAPMGNGGKGGQIEPEARDAQPTSSQHQQRGNVARQSTLLGAEMELRSYAASASGAAINIPRMSHV
ncbi:hypothetical protein R1sor_011265 [Riccia sorocarpa]|uniref:Uncharacterized protein n=1 Tax=Riccia sorocarpa TaxID=122646 RepID=A0ABD3I6F5_9MARC